MQQPISLVRIAPPPPEQRAQRGARFAEEGEKRGRYHLPTSLSSGSPVGYRTRLALSEGQAAEAAALLSLQRPTAFVEAEPVTERELFEESSLGVLVQRQSTNFMGHRQVTLGPEGSRRVTTLLAKLQGLEAPVLEGAAYTHLCLSRPYRTPFTMLLTFIGHAPVSSLFTVPLRGLRKRFQHVDDIPTIGYLQHLHLGIWADGLERAVLLASGGRRAAQLFSAPFCGQERRAANASVIAELEQLAGLTSSELSVGWTVHMVAQVGQLPQAHPIRRSTCRRLGANLLAFRSERIQPGVNQEDKAPPAYQSRQDMDVPEELAFMAARGAYNAFEHWTGLDRDQVKDQLLLERVDPLTEGGKERLRAIRRELGEITEKCVDNIPLWADLPLGRALSRNAARGRKAFALAGQRIYIGGLDKRAVAEAGLPWEQAVRAFGAAAARSSLVCELSGCFELPEDCDLLSGICLMAGPVNQNDIGKEFYGFRDLLADAYPQGDPTSLLVWTLKAKTVADPVGNEQQLMDPARKGALVELRAAPHEVVTVVDGDRRWGLRDRDGRRNGERAFGDQDNFVRCPQGGEVPGNRGSAWPEDWASESLWR